MAEHQTADEPLTLATWWQDSIGRARIMAEAEGWCMMRRPGCMPFLLYRKELLAKWKPLTLAGER